MRKTDEFETKHKPSTDSGSITELTRVDEQRFTKELDNLIKESEDMRLRRMRQHRTCSLLALNINILFMTLGVGVFAWYILMEFNPALAFTGLLSAVIVAVIANLFTKMPLRAYARDHKRVFMPKLAKALNGLEFHPQRGVSAKILEKLGTIPKYERYEAEDCFMGVYKGVKVIMSEARLYDKTKKDGMAFDGIFVLLENPDDVIEGHTIITANKAMTKAYESTRWKSMKRVFVSPINPDWDIFDVFSTKPEAAELVVGDRLLKELAEASFVFENAPLTAVLFGKRYVFLMIPYEKDMFEASNVFVPITTRDHALHCKKEIEQLLEVIDVFDLYKTIKS